MGGKGKESDLPPRAPPTIAPVWEVAWEAEGREDAVMVLPAGKIWVTCTTVVKATPLEVELRGGVD